MNMLSIQRWDVRCEWRGVPAMELWDREHVRVCLQRTGPTYKILGTPSTPSTATGDKEMSLRKELEKTCTSESLLRVLRHLRLAQPARTIRSPKCRWSGMKCTLCPTLFANCHQTSSSEELSKEMQSLFCPSCLITVLAAFMK